MSDDDFMPPEMTLATIAGLDTDSMLVPCPECGNQLRADVRTKWRTLAEASEVYGFEITPAIVLESGGKLDSFGRVKAGVPYVTCMHCGFTADASREGFAVTGEQEQ